MNWSAIYASHLPDRTASYFRGGVYAADMKCPLCGEPVNDHTAEEAHACFKYTAGTEQVPQIEDLLEIINDADNPVDGWKIECGHPHLTYTIDVECSWLDAYSVEEVWSMRLDGETMKHALEKTVLALDAIMSEDQYWEEGEEEA